MDTAHETEIRGFRSQTSVWERVALERGAGPDSVIRRISLQNDILRQSYLRTSLEKKKASLESEARKASGDAWIQFSSARRLHRNPFRRGILGLFQADAQDGVR